ncbi:response regulator [Conexibacter sp. W3-3-2]|uniref:DNA-binding response regulator n=1 Tax=Paraconexibacter algicola TaxID=2133960 RepID=A0A2T4UDD0_9ACTN|nr:MULTISPECIES: response regulator transcription factor [Solirubrobacterales]MTD43555.1 response regulator [Conexibacter sp. W3-3-2]PTL55485.1 DNA-binding response regulator [Paraconexibacter algicola]
MSDNDQTATTILLVEDDDLTRRFLADNLTADGYDLLVAATATEGMRLAETRYPDVAILDVGLPDGTGLELLDRIRESDGVANRVDRDLPVMLLSGRAAEIDRIRGFQRGADDYVAKPYAYAELQVRIAALLRRAAVRRRGGRMRVGPIELDPGARLVRLNGELLHLSQKEFALLQALLEEPTRVRTKDELMQTVWGCRAIGTSRTLDSHACRLRHKLGRDGDRFIVNVWGVGYRLIDGPGPSS